MLAAASITVRPTLPLQRININIVCFLSLDVGRGNNDENTSHKYMRLLWMLSILRRTSTIPTCQPGSPWADDSVEVGRCPLVKSIASGLVKPSGVKPSGVYPIGLSAPAWRNRAVATQSPLALAW